MKHLILTGFIIFLCNISTGHAALLAKKPNIAGYYKSLLISTQSSTTQEDLFALTNRLRIKVNQEINEQWQVQLTVDNEVILSDTGHSSELDFTRSKVQNLTSTIDLDKVSADNDHVYAKHSVYRVYVKYYTPEFQAVLGKQAIDWGKMRFYSPIDLFNTPGPIDIEHEERVGADAINLNFALSDFSGINVIYIPGDYNSKQSYGLKAYKTIGTYDISIIAANVRKNISLGIAFDGYVKQAGFRGEITHNIFDNDREFARVSLGADYNINDKVYVLMEQFYNGGANDNDITALSTSFNKARELLSLKKHLTAFSFNYEITPLIDFNTHFIYDWEGESGAVNPEVKYSLSESLDFSLGAQLFWGTFSSEFGNSENLFYFQVEYYF